MSGGESTLADISMFLYVKVFAMYAHSRLWELVAWPTIIGMVFGYVMLT